MCTSVGTLEWLWSSEAIVHNSYSNPAAGTGVIETDVILKINWSHIVHRILIYKHNNLKLTREKNCLNTVYHLQIIGFTINNTNWLLICRDTTQKMTYSEWKMVFDNVYHIKMHNYAVNIYYKSNVRCFRI